MCVTSGIYVATIINNNFKKLKNAKSKDKLRCKEEIPLYRNW